MSSLGWNYLIWFNVSACYLNSTFIMLLHFTYVHYLLQRY